MAVLQLPQVIFEQIIDEVVENEEILSIARTLHHRLVCRVFDTFVSDRVIRRASRTNIEDREVFRKPRTVYCHQTFGTAILRRKVAIGNDKTPLVEGLNALLDALMEREGLADPRGEVAAEIRTRYAKNLCDALRALDYWTLYKTIGPWNSGQATLQSAVVAVTAAIGHVQMFSNAAHSVEDILKPNDVFPNALHAAVAANQLEVVDMILKRLCTAVEARQVSTEGARDDVLSIAPAMMEALRIAIRLFHNPIANLIIEAMLGHKPLADSVRAFSAKILHHECVKYGNHKLYLTTLRWTDALGHRMPSEKPLGCAKALRHIIRSGTPSLLRGLTRDGTLDPNVIEEDTPLWQAITRGRYHMAKVLLEEGADIDAVLPGRTDSAYWRAVKMVYRDKMDTGDMQWFLIGQGADTRPMSEHTKPKESRTEGFAGIREYSTNHVREIEFHEWQVENWRLREFEPRR